MVLSPVCHRIVRVIHEGRTVWGIAQEESVFSVAGSPFEGPPEVVDRLGSIADLDVRAPVEPTKVVCVGRNYVAHAAEHGAEVPIEPLLFLKPSTSVLAPGGAIQLTPLSQQVEHEGELALVIGKRCRNLTADEAWKHVLGITCGNDVTARDLQRIDPQWTRAKGFDTFCPLGPWIVTGLEEEDVADLMVECRVNGETRQSGRTSEMVFSPAVILEYITAVMTLEPGDVVMTGTPAGVGPLGSGDVVDVVIEGVGTLTNPVA
jgi:2-keto-4-pentenoate hydratase/2-oxohepta-3-ene-1,7-dioic acid hydratase in catechol pathway